MTISVDVLAFLVSLATLVTAVAPVVLIILWVRDWLNKQIW